MRRRGRHRASTRGWLAAALGGGLLWLGGCFALDEIDQAQKKVPSPKAKAEAPAAATRGGSAQEKLRAYYDRPSRRKVEEDPANPIVRCQTGGRVEFMRKHDCDVRGGGVQI